MRQFIWVCLLGLAWPTLMAQSPYWIHFTDKNDTEHLQPEQLFSPRALARRQQQGISIDHRDYPVSPQYVAALQQMGVPIRHSSRWFNSVSATLDAAQIAEVSRLPFVADIQPLGHYQATLAEIQACPDSAELNSPMRQLEMLDLDVLHRNGLTGEGVLVAVFDNGYQHVDSLPGFDHLHAENRILATRDFVDGDDDVYHGCNHCRHGTYVFSILAAVMPGQLVGSAPGASYLLLRTENDASETPQEEDNWVAAAEFADSMGAQIFTTSLGYGNFDGVGDDYSNADFDGNTAIITRAGDIAASRGILVVNSAGNNGANGLNAPADGDSILAVGAVDGCEAYASFSSQGPTADGRIKPDLTAMGRANFFLHSNGSIRRGNGTSFSCPLVSGLAACLFQSYPSASNMDVYNALLRSGDRFDTPDNLFGHGIPKGILAWRSLAEISTATGSPIELQTGLGTVDPFEVSDWIIYPNPTTGQVYLSVKGELSAAQLRIGWTDLVGRRVGESLLAADNMTNPQRIDAPREAGIYVLRVIDDFTGEQLFVGRVNIQ